MRKFLLSAAMLFAAVAVFGQTVLPNDPEVRTGKLDNGLTYYIRHNANPEDRAEFYLATNVGAIQETPDQDGLAHFLEHMCFNGTKNLPGKTMLDYLQKIGAEFGRNINAGTGVEETTYMLNNIPVTRTGIIDTCLLIMHDYSHYVTCDPEEIDKERGVILEERRTRRNAAWRMHEKSLPYYYGDSKYATCTLIGSEENLKNFKPESLVNFYKTWYRPDLQAVIVVGDVDVDYVENKIKSLFGDIPAAENPQPKENIIIPGNDEPVIGIITDPEATATTLEILWKKDAMPEMLNNTDAGFMLEFMKGIVANVMSERFNDITANPEAPFLYAGLGTAGLCETCEPVLGSVVCKDGESIPAFKAFLTEVEKMKLYGFSESEVSRAKENILTVYKKNAEGASTRKNEDFVQGYIDNFFDNYSYMVPEVEYELAQQISAVLTADVVNQFTAALIPENNLVIVYKAPEKEGIAHPSEADFLNAIAEVESSEIEANEEQNFDIPLMDADALAGSKVENMTSTVSGAEEWTLANGLKVVVLPVDYRKDEVKMNLRMPGGRSLIATEDLVPFEENIFAMYLGNTGIAGFSGTDLRKVLAGKTASAMPYISSTRHGISASSTPKDIETAFQLMYLLFTEPRFDETEFMTGINQLKAILPNVLKQPDFIFSGELTKTLYGNNPRQFTITMETLEKADLATLKRVYESMYDNVSGAVLTIVGNVDKESLLPLVEKYAGSLPGTGTADKWTDTGEGLVKGNVENHFAVNMETPKNTVLQIYSAYIPYSVETSVMMDAAKYILDMIYTETLREEEGGTYGASVGCDLRYEPDERATIQVYFETNPESAAKLTASAKASLYDLMKNGPTDEQVAMAVANFRKNLPESRNSLDYWAGNIETYYECGIDYDKEYEAAIEKISAKNIQKVLKKILKQGNFIEVMMYPADATANN